jgi:2-methylcitrate dehydratase PrpD
MTIDRRSLLKGAVITAAAPLLPPGVASGQSAAPAAARSAGPSLSATQRIARFIHSVRFEDIPAEVIQKAKEQIVYHFGLAFSGRATGEAGQMRLISNDLAQPKGASVIGERFHLLTSDAVFANTTLMRATWRDDVIWPSGIHAGLCALPTALAIAETRRLSGREFLTAIILAYEVMGKLGNAADGWAAPMPRRPTMIYGPFGPVTVVSRLLKFDNARTAHALGYASNSGMGVPEGGQTEHYYSLLTRNATFAALVAEAGGTAYANSTIEGDTGLYKSFFGKVPASLPTVLGKLGFRWEIMSASQKRYPGTGQNTVATELLTSMVKEHRLRPEQIERIDVVLASVDDSAERKKELSSPGPFASWNEAWSSLPFSLALVLSEGRVDPSRYFDRKALAEPRLGLLMRRVTIRFEGGHDSIRYARLELLLKDGRKMVQASDNFAFPFPQSAWKDWLAEDGRRFLSSAQLESLERDFRQLEKLEDVGAIMSNATPLPHA